MLNIMKMREFLSKIVATAKLLTQKFLDEDMTNKTFLSPLKRLVLVSMKVIDSRNYNVLHILSIPQFI